jgi:hypothetical protein
MDGAESQLWMLTVELGGPRVMARWMENAVTIAQMN